MNWSMPDFAPDGLEFCPEHPDAEIRKEYNAKQYLLNGEPAGKPIQTSPTEYFCNVCDRPLRLDPITTTAQEAENE